LKKLIAIGLIVVSAGAWAEWTEVFTNANGDIFYVDISTLKTGQRPRIWVFNRYAEVSSETGVGSNKRFIEGDCAEGRLRALTASYYRDRDGTKLDTMDDDPGKWIYPSPRSFHSALFKILCGKEP
jgi:hypothetical protein